MRAARHTVAMSGALLGLALGYGPCPAAMAEDSWSPFKSNAERPGDRRPRPSEAATPVPPAPVYERAPGPAGPPSAPWASPRGGAVEKSELAPIMAPDASGLPLELWRGLDLKTLEELLAGLELPPRSPALHQLWRRMLLSSATPPAGASNPEHFVALRLEALYRSGLLADMEKVLSENSAPGPVVQTLRARLDIGLGRRDAGCQAVATLAAPSSGLPGRLKGETQLLAGYCAAAANDAQAAGLAADLAREEGIEAELPLAVLTGVATGTKPKLALPAARPAARLPVPGAVGPGQRHPDLRQGRAGAARRAGRRPQDRCAAADRRGRGGAAAQCAVAGGHGGGLSPAAAGR